MSREQHGGEPPWKATPDPAPFASDAVEAYTEERIAEFTAEEAELEKLLHDLE